MVAEILIITPYFWPELAATVPLYKALAEDLAGAGHHVTVFTSKLSSGAQKICQESDPDSTLKHIPGKNIIRVSNPFSRKPGALAKLLEYAWFSFWAVFRVLFQRRVQVCIVMSNPPLLALPIALIGRIKRFATVYDLQDLFPDSAAAAGLVSHTSILYRFLRKLEHWTYAAASLNVAICESYKRHILEVTPRAKVEIVPNWVDTDIMRSVPGEDNVFRKSAALDGKFVVLYAGTVGFLQDISTLLRAAALLADFRDILFVIVGEGPQKEGAVREARRLGLRNCVFYDFQPDELIPHVYSAGDVGAIPMRPRSDPMPSKTWNYMACGCPVIAAVDLDSELAMRLQETEAGIVVPCGDESAMSQAIINLYKNPVRREIMGRKAYEYVISNLSRYGITAMYEQLIRSLVTNPRREELVL